MYAGCSAASANEKSKGRIEPLLQSAMDGEGVDHDVVLIRASFECVHSSLLPRICIGLAQLGPGWPRDPCRVFACS